jgi:spore maturation protein CgeB
MPEPLSIAFFGSSLVSSYWNDAATYYRGILHALARRGHRVTFYEPDACDRQNHRDIDEPSWARVVVYSAATPDHVLQTVEQASREADLVVKAGGVGVHDTLLEGAVLAHRRPGARVVFWDVDAPATLDRLQADPLDPLRALIPHYDLVLARGGGDTVVQAYEGLGAARCVPIYDALDPDTHHPVPAQAAYSATLGFLGNRLPDRETRVDEFFLKPAANRPRASFLLAGGGWADKTLPDNVRRLGHLGSALHNAFNCSCLAVLDINRESMARCGFSPPTRLFEAAGAGACLLTDRWEGVELFLEPGFEILVAADGAEVADWIDQLTPARALAIGRAARRRILSEHTYGHRVNELEALLDARTAEALSA